MILTRHNSALDLQSDQNQSLLYQNSALDSDIGGGPHTVVPP